MNRQPEPTMHAEALKALPISNDTQFLSISQCHCGIGIGLDHAFFVMWGPFLLVINSNIPFPPAYGVLVSCLLEAR